ncbi:unnamed protein product [Microthlaspi erraticum]|uniref:Probable purine permease n=1 Tax=Microthlaspi erraticum TaxID=1685480 RepID=A0A6D2JLI8_9BRAS|nr:unnamed protein product [Microthlaspi erraticum]
MYFFFVEQFYQIPLDIEHDRINQTSDSNRRRRKKWITIIICIIMAVTGQSIVRLLENYYFLHRNLSRRYGAWTQSLIQVIGFPLLTIPFLVFFLLSSKKKKQIHITSTHLAILYPIISMYIIFQAYFSNLEHRLPFRVFTLIYTTQVLFTPIFSIYYNKTKFTRWMIISLVFAIITGAFTLYTFSAGSPIYDGNNYNHRLIFSAVCAAMFFSMLLCQIRSIFENLISLCKESTDRKQPSFVAVLEVLIFSSLIATVFLVLAVFISGEHRDLKRHMDEFSKGEFAYVRTMVGLAAAWQIYWVEIVGLVFVVSAVFSMRVNKCNVGLAQ